MNILKQLASDALHTSALFRIARNCCSPDKASVFLLRDYWQALFLQNAILYHSEEYHRLISVIL